MIYKTLHAVCLIACLSLLCCRESPEKDKVAANPEKKYPAAKTYDSLYKTIHVFVALCDNQYQGIVPVPAKIGNGQDKENNLYWGCGFGIRTYFKKSAEWKFLKSESNPKKHILERVIFKHISKNYYLVADAYDGKYIKECTVDFLESASGLAKETLAVNDITIGTNGNASLVSYIGHDGLMDFDLDGHYQNTDGKKRQCIILACSAKHFFAPFLKSAKANPLVWTTNLMCPEAYTLHDAISGYVKNETDEQIRSRAAASYDKHQKCGIKAARNLLVTGF